MGPRKIDGWNRTIDVNLKGGPHGIAAALPYMEKQTSGHINQRLVGGRPHGPPGDLESVVIIFRSIPSGAERSRTSQI